MALLNSGDSFMSKIRRFYSIKSLNSHVVHRFYGKRFTEGETTACGIRVQRGWKYWLGARTPKCLDISTDCKRCAVSVVSQFKNSLIGRPESVNEARAVVERAVFVAERTGDGKYAENLLISFSDGLSKFKEGFHVVAVAARVTEPGELVRIYVTLNNVTSAVERDLLAAQVAPFLKGRCDLILKKDAEGFKICRRKSQESYEPLPL